mgnify:CR=1 FL=1
MHDIGRYWVTLDAVALGWNCQRGNRGGLECLVINWAYVVMPIVGWTVVSKGRPYRKGGQDMSGIVRGVSKRMGKNDVLRNVSIEVDPGTVVGLQGINGSGKTMLMRAVCGLIKPTEGEISIDGQRLGADISFPPSLGMLIEAPSFLGYLSGYDNLKLIAQIKGVATPEDIRSAAARGARCRRKKEVPSILAWDEAASGDSCGNYGEAEAACSR